MSDLYTPLHEKIAKEITERLGQHVGLNADWNCMAWRIDDHTFVLDWDDEPDTYLVVGRWYLEDGYHNMPYQHREHADGMNDAIPTLHGPMSGPEMVAWLNIVIRVQRRAKGGAA